MTAFPSKVPFWLQSQLNNSLYQFQMVHDYIVTSFWTFGIYWNLVTTCNPWQIHFPSFWIDLIKEQTIWRERNGQQAGWGNWPPPRINLTNTPDDVWATLFARLPRKQHQGIHHEALLGCPTLCSSLGLPLDQCRGRRRWNRLVQYWNLSTIVPHDSNSNR